MSAQRSNFADVDIHFQAACMGFYTNIRILCDRTVSLQHRLHFFEAVVSSVACYAATTENVQL